MDCSDEKRGDSLIHPELYELEYLFECDAFTSDENIPWVYCFTSFRLTRENRQILFTIDIASRNGEVNILVDQDQLIRLDLENIKLLSILKDGLSEGLKIEFDHENYVLPLIIHTKPHISITWGTSLDLQR